MQSAFSGFADDPWSGFADDEEEYNRRINALWQDSVQEYENDGGNVNDTDVGNDAMDDVETSTTTVFNTKEEDDFVDVSDSESKTPPSPNNLLANVESSIRGKEISAPVPTAPPPTPFFTRNLSKYTSSGSKRPGRRVSSNRAVPAIMASDSTQSVPSGNPDSDWEDINPNTSMTDIGSFLRSSVYTALAPAPLNTPPSQTTTSITDTTNTRPIKAAVGFKKRLARQNLTSQTALSTIDTMNTQHIKADVSLQSPTSQNTSSTTDTMNTRPIKAAVGFQKRLVRQSLTSGLPALPHVPQQSSNLPLESTHLAETTSHAVPNAIPVQSNIQILKPGQPGLNASRYATKTIGTLSTPKNDIGISDSTNIEKSTGLDAKRGGDSPGTTPTIDSCPTTSKVTTASPSNLESQNGQVNSSNLPHGTHKSIQSVSLKPNLPTLPPSLPIGLSTVNSSNLPHGTHKSIQSVSLKSNLPTLPPSLPVDLSTNRNLSDIGDNSQLNDALKRGDDYEQRYKKEQDRSDDYKQMHKNEKSRADGLQMTIQRQQTFLNEQESLVKALKSQISRLEALHRDPQKEIDRLAKELNDANELIDDKDDILNDFKEKFDHAQGTIKTRDGEIQGLKDEVEGLEIELSRKDAHQSTEADIQNRITDAVVRYAAKEQQDFEDSINARVKAAVNEYAANMRQVSEANIKANIQAGIDEYIALQKEKAEDSAEAGNIKELEEQSEQISNEGRVTPDTNTPMNDAQQRVAQSGSVLVTFDAKTSNGSKKSKSTSTIKSWFNFLLSSLFYLSAYQNVISQCLELVSDNATSIALQYGSKKWGALPVIWTSSKTNIEVPHATTEWEATNNLLAWCSEIDSPTFAENPGRTCQVPSLHSKRPILLQTPQDSINALLNWCAESANPDLDDGEPPLSRKRPNTNWLLRKFSKKQASGSQNAANTSTGTPQSSSTLQNAYISGDWVGVGIGCTWYIASSWWKHVHRDGRH